jgi:hypothetical protein
LERNIFGDWLGQGFAHNTAAPLHVTEASETLGNPRSAVHVHHGQEVQGEEGEAGGERPKEGGGGPRSLLALLLLGLASPQVLAEQQELPPKHHDKPAATGAAASTSTTAANTPPEDVASDALSQLQTLVRTCLALVRDDMQPWVESAFAGEYRRWCEAVANTFTPADTNAQLARLRFPKDGKAM